MPCPATHPGNVNKHPGDIIRNANRQQCTKEEIATEKKKKEKLAKSAAAEQARMKTAIQEDTMAIEQQAQLTGPPKLADPGDAQSAQTKLVVTQNPEQKRHGPLRLMFKESIVANHKVSNSGISISDGSETRVGSTFSKDGKQITKLLTYPVLLRLDLLARYNQPKFQPGMGKLSAPLSLCTTVTNDIDFDLDDVPEEYVEPCRGRGRKAVIHIHQKPTNMQKDKKRAFSAVDDSEVEEAGDADGFADEEALEMLDDPDADADDEDRIQDADDGEDQIQDSDVDMEVAIRSTISIIDVSDKHTDMKRIKTEEGTSKAVSINSRKAKPQNAHIPDDIIKSWRAKFLPALMYWVGNSSYGWTIPEEDLCNALYEISGCIGGKNWEMCDFEVGTYGYELAVQKIHKWKALFGSTAITILMAFFASKPEYEMQAEHKAFTDEQLEDSRFVYKNPESEDNPGAFLSEYFLCTFTTHLNAIIGHEKVDTLDSGIMGLETALALTAAAAECALCLVSNNYLVLCDPSDSNSKKNHKIELTFNESTNRMSHTGTAFPLLTGRRT
ncbi:hypothetical protein F4604DRAFT_1936515 [Suillus subluteus]|nr:hypothetical protein F4604DRAFT_1936515 [Suillus subluteus]